MDEQRRSNEGLLSALDEALTKEDSLVTSILVMLIEVEERRLHLALAYSSMFDFCRRRLKLSESEAFIRITAARLARRLPQLLDALRTRRLHLSTIVLLRKLFTAENVDELIATASGKSKREVERIVAKLAPRPDVAASIRKLPNRAPLVAASSALETSHAHAPPLAAVRQVSQAGATAITQPQLGFSSAGARTHSRCPPSAAVGNASDASSTPSAVLTAVNAKTDVLLATQERPYGQQLPAARTVPVRHQVAEISESRHRVQFTASSALREKLERAQSLMRHRNIDGDLAVVVERALDVLITKLEKQKFATTSRPRSQPSDRSEPARNTPPRASVLATTAAKVTQYEARQPAQPEGTSAIHEPPFPPAGNTRRAISAATRRAVVERDREQCAFVGINGVSV